MPRGRRRPARGGGSDPVCSERGQQEKALATVGRPGRAQQRTVEQTVGVPVPMTKQENATRVPKVIEQVAPVDSC